MVKFALALPLRRSVWQVLPARYWVVADQATVSGTTFLTNLFVARMLGLSTFGEFSAWQMGLLLLLAAQGALITQPMQVVLATVPATNRAAYRRALLGMQGGFGVAAAGLATGAALLLRPQAGAVLVAFLVYLATAILQDTVRKLLLAEDRVPLALLTDAVSCGGQLLALLAWVAAGRSATLAAVFWVMGLTTLPALALGLPALLRDRSAGPGWTTFARQHWQQARWLLPTAALQWLSGNVLLVLAGLSTPLATLGILRLAQTIMGVFNVGLQAAENYVLPRLSLSLRRSEAEFRRQRARLTRLMLGLAAGPLLALALLADPLVRWVQSAEAAHSSVLRWCCLLYVVILLVYPLRLTVRLLPSARPYFVGYALSIGFSVLSARWLLTHYQATGVVVGWIGAQLVLGLYWSLILSRRPSFQHPHG
ncbi:MATE family efflux transporter [Hymenobacter swuensis]|uniref:Polysaccharide biosynthesis protein C-terminal domain-containing protein n=1 Tax=Hymenobacter swuensis DY53 TaxID=1227739 RepID=W8ESH2_9BACT|nr:hypothetical protein [Hymenobacter swuensis]AHJ95473.1 hypothetical protein Hsw_PA0140 [Hymenobacter swuensis DY53]